MARYLILSVLLILGTVQGWAFGFEPISADFTSSGSGTVRTFRVKNDSQETIAVRISMFSRTADTAGRDILENADARFVVFPARITLKPGTIQSVRVQWRGGPVTGNEQAYRIVAEQLPVSFSRKPESGGSINIMFRYVGSVYIVPDRAQPRVEVVSVVKKTDGTGGRFLELELSNPGTAHALLQNLKVSITSGRGGSTVTLQGEALKGFEGENILSGHTRIFTVAWPEGLPEGTLDAVLQFDPGR